MLKKDRFKSTIQTTVGQPIADIMPPEDRGEGRERMEGTRRMKNARMIQIDKIKPDPDQPRKTFNQELLVELSNSIKEHGILQPITVDYIEEGEYYKIITGERRYQAAKLVNLSAMPCIVLDDVDSKDRYAKQMIENIQREDFTPIDKARALLEYKEMLGDTTPWEEVEKLVGISRRRRQQFLALLNLPENIQKEIVVIGRRPANNQITEKHARALLLLNHLPEKQNELFELIRNAEEPITGDVALEKAKEMQGKKEVHRFSIAYKNERELLQKLEEKVEELKRVLEV